MTVRYPRNAGIPIECFVVVAEYFPGEDAYEVHANFQGPLALFLLVDRMAPGASFWPWIAVIACFVLYAYIPGV